MTNVAENIKTSFLTRYRNPITTVLVMILLGGIFFYAKMHVSLFPEITFPKIKIIADAGLQPVDRMMVSVTRPLELAIKRIPDLTDIRSTTSRGSCEISAFIDWNADIDLSQQRIEARIAEIRNTLPADVNITVEKMNPSILPVMGYSMESHQLSPIELKLLALYTIQPFLSQVPGVSEVRIIGGKSKEFWIQLDVQKMSSLGITPDMVNTSITQSAFIKSNGYLSDYRHLYLTVTDASLKTLDQLKNLVVRNDSKRVVTLADVADIKVNEAVEYIKVNANGKEGLLIAIVKQPNANLVDLSEKMKQKVAELQKILPKEVRLKPYYVQSDFVNESVRSVTDSLWIGLVLAIIVAIIFLRSFKASITILLTIPVTLCMTLILMYSLGYTLNIMTLGAIAAAIGLIIDDAIVVVEQIHRTHEESPEDPYPLIVSNAIRYLFPAMVGSSLSTIVIFIPFMLMSGVAGAYFNVLTNTMIITLVSSFFVTWLGLPVIYLIFSRRNKKTLKHRQEKPHAVKKQRWVGAFITRPIISILIVFVLIAAIIFILPRLETGFLPEMDEGSIVLDYTSIPGTSLEETDKELQQVEKIIISTPEVAAYSRRTGTQMGFFITEPNDGDYLIQLKSKRDKTTGEVIDDIRQRIEASQPALRVDFGQVIGDMLGDLMTSVQPIEIKIFGDDQEQLHKMASQVGHIVETTPGTADVFDGIVITGPSIDVKPDYGRLAMYGITPVDFQYQVQTALEGNTAGDLFQKDRLFPLRIVYPGSRARSLQSLRDLKIFAPGGQLHPLTELATFEVHEGTPQIERENLQSMGVVSARLNNRDLGSTIKEIRTRIGKQVSMPQGYSVEYGGEYAEQQRSFDELLTILITASLLVFGTILFLYRDFRVALTILFIALLGIAGCYLALFITHTPLNVGSYTGIIMIVGIIGENAIFTFLQFRENLHHQSVDESLIFSISTRLRPKLMTALGAIIALLPLALGIGAGAELHQPLAIAVIGGFLIALPLLLIVLPSALRLIFRGKELRQPKYTKDIPA